MGEEAYNELIKIIDKSNAKAKYRVREIVVEEAIVTENYTVEGSIVSEAIYDLNDDKLVALALIQVNGSYLFYEGLNYS